MSFENTANQAGADWPHYEAAPPHVEITLQDGRADVSGRAHCKLGAPVESQKGSPPGGVFAHWHWDGETLTAGVDPLGFFSLFVYCKGSTVAVSPSLLQLIALGADTTPDRRALGVFFRLGLFVNDDTPFKHIRVLPAGGGLTWKDGKANVTGAEFLPKEQTITRDGAVEGMIDLPRASLKNILGNWQGDTVLPLSGGRDSRHILLELERLNALPQACVTFQHSGSVLNAEARAAREICERVGVRHDILGHPRARSQDILRALVLSSLCSDEHSQMLPLHDHLGTRSWAALDGIAGDILTNPDNAAEAHYQRAQAGNFEAIALGMMEGHAAVISKPGHVGGAGSIYAPDTHDEAVAYLTETITRYADAPDPYQAFWFWNRTRREIGFVSSSIFASASAVFCPYLDRRFVEFCLSLPYAVTRDQRLHDDAISRAFPQYKDVPYGDSFAAPPAGRGSISGKIVQSLKGVATIRALDPEHPMAEFRNYLAGYPVLNRRPGEVLQLYDLVLSGLDAAFAKKVLKLAKTYRNSSPKILISDSFLPDTVNGS